MFTTPVIERPQIRISLSTRRRMPEQWGAWFRLATPSLKDFAPHHRTTGKWLQSLTPGSRPEPEIDIWPRGHGKCLRGDTTVIRATGEPARLRDVRVDDYLLSWSEETGAITSGRVSRRWESGVKPLLAIRTRTGRVINATKGHRIRTFEGWLEAGNVQVGDRIPSPRRITTSTDSARPEAEARLLAYMLAEGSCSGSGFQHNSTFSNISPVIREDFARCAGEMGFWARGFDPRTMRLGGGGKAWLRENGLAGCTALTKRVPTWMFRQPDHIIEHFLAAFLDTDGWFSGQQAGISLANALLVSDLRVLSLRLGLFGSVYAKENDHAGSWELVYDQGVLPRLAGLPLNLKRDRACALAESERYSLTDTYPNKVVKGLPYGVNRRLRRNGVRLSTPHAVTRGKIQRALVLEPHQEWEWLEDADVFWDEVVAIDDAAPAETYDIEIAGLHNFIADGLVVHNSTFAEHGVAYVAERKKRRFALYICATQDASEIHVSNIQALLEKIGGDVGRRLENIYGHSKGWKKTMLRTASGFNCAAFGLDQAMRGVKLEDYRPDLIILDDVDGRHDTAATTRKKIEILTQSILPAGSDDLAVWGVQNLIIPNGIFSRLADGRADFLATRNVNGPVKAVRELVTEEEFMSEWDGQSLNRRIHVIKGGEPTWQAFDLHACQQEIIDLGWRAFDREKQNNVKDVDGALWTQELLNATRFRASDKTDYEKNTLQLGDLTRVVVSVDPATTSKDSSDETGIIGCGRTAGRHGFVLADDSNIRKPAEWGRAAVLMHDRIGASCIVGESNQGGEMVEDVIANAARKLFEDGHRDTASIAVKLIHASKRKRARAEPVAQMYEEHAIHHVGAFDTLEDQMTTWDASDGSESPDRVDALVWGMTELGVARQKSPAVTFSNMPI